MAAFRKTGASSQGCATFHNRAKSYAPCDRDPNGQIGAAGRACSKGVWWLRETPKRPLMQAAQGCDVLDENRAVGCSLGRGDTAKGRGRGHVYPRTKAKRKRTEPLVHPSRKSTPGYILIRTAKPQRVFRMQNRRIMWGDCPKHREFFRKMNLSAATHRCRPADIR